jgi:hypothetical protein
MLLRHTQAVTRTYMLYRTSGPVTGPHYIRSMVTSRQFVKWKVERLKYELDCEIAINKHYVENPLTADKSIAVILWVEQIVKKKLTEKDYTSVVTVINTVLLEDDRITLVIKPVLNIRRMIKGSRSVTI